jgi:hypothetical protein
MFDLFWAVFFGVLAAKLAEWLIVSTVRHFRK